MDYESFKEQFIEDVKDRLYEQGAEVNVSVHEVNKLNESYEAITVTPEGSNIGVNIGIDKFYDAIENGKSYDGDTMSTGRLYDQFGKKVKAKIVYVIPGGAICKMVEMEEPDEGIECCGGLPMPEKNTNQEAKDQELVHSRGVCCPCLSCNKQA